MSHGDCIITTREAPHVQQRCVPRVVARRKRIFIRGPEGPAILRSLKFRARNWSGDSLDEPISIGFNKYDFFADASVLAFIRSDLMAKQSLRFSTRWVIGLVWVVWALLMWQGNRWPMFVDNWFMSLTMACGSFIAGATSEGGGAVAFPVMTLVFNIKPHVARDFSLMIQSVGMIAATVAIMLTRVPIERRTVFYASLGGAIGMVLGLEHIAPRLSPPFAKMFFVSVWLSFALSLYWMNRAHGRVVIDRILGFQTLHGGVLIGVGIIGGVISSITGSGLDIITFSLLVMAFRVDEKVATPTSVILMGFNALIGFIWKGLFGSQALATHAWDYWWVCVPIVVIGAPLGVRFIAGRSRLFIAGFLYLSILVQFILAIAIIPQSWNLLVFSCMTLIGGGILFRLMDNYGARRLAMLERLEAN